MEKTKNCFETLNDLNVNEHTEKKQSLTYLTWSWAWAEVKKLYPEASYVIKKFENNLPYVYDENTGYMVFTEVTIEGMTHEMWLPVMDSKNKAMKNAPYEYKTKYDTKEVEAATMFDINKTIMRCLVKNFAMFGLGLYIYSGEDLPEDDKKEIEKEASKLDKLKEKIKSNPKGIEIIQANKRKLSTYSEKELKEIIEKLEGETNE